MKNFLSLHGLGCGSDTISLLNAEEPDFLTALEMLDINIAWHPSLSLEKGDEVLKICTDFIEERRVLDFFVIEGAIPTSPEGSGLLFEFMGKPFAEWVKELSRVAEYTIAVGTCATTGGIPASPNNPTGAALGCRIAPLWGCVANTARLR